MTIMEGLRTLASQVNFKKPPATLGRVFQIEELRNTYERGKRMQALSAQAGWKEIQNELTRRFEVQSSALRSAQTWEEARSIQASLIELEYLLGIVPSAIADGERAGKELESAE